MAITLRSVTGSALSYEQLDTNLSSYFYSASLSGSNITFFTTGSTGITGVPEPASMSISITTTSPWTTLGNGTLSRNGNIEITGSLAQGSGSYTSGIYAHAEGYNTLAQGGFSHAEGYSVSALATGSHAEGKNTQTTATATYAHAEGHYTIASGLYSHAEGDSTGAQGTGSHAEGTSTLASANFAHSEGDSTTASGQSSHAEGTSTIDQDLIHMLKEIILLHQDNPLTQKDTVA